jgi:hypothetical protein
MSMIVKYGLRILRMEIEDPVRVCYEWQMDSLKEKSWAKKLKEEYTD